MKTEIDKSAGSLLGFRQSCSKLFYNAIARVETQFYALFTE